MKEKIIQTLFSRKNTISTIYEIKLVKFPNKNLAYSKLEPHQITSLTDANNNTGLSYKMSDMSIDKKPCDGFRVSNHPAHIIVVYYVPRKTKIAYYVPIKLFIENVKPGGSLSEEMAKKLSEYQIVL